MRLPHSQVAEPPSAWKHPSGPGPAHRPRRPAAVLPARHRGRPGSRSGRGHGPARPGGRPGRRVNGPSGAVARLSACRSPPGGRRPDLGTLRRGGHSRSSATRPARGAWTAARRAEDAGRPAPGDARGHEKAPTGRGDRGRGGQGGHAWRSPRGETLHRASAERSSLWAIGEARGHCPIRTHGRFNGKPPAGVPSNTRLRRDLRHPRRRPG